MAKRRGRKRAIALVVILVLFLGGGYYLSRLLLFKPLNIDHFFERVFIYFALEDPETLTRLRILEPFGLRFHNDDLTDISDAHAKEMLQFGKDNLATLRSYDRKSLSDSQRLSADILDWFLEDVVSVEPFMYHNYPVNQLFGIQNEMPTFMATMHQINDERDARDYIARLNKFNLKFDQTLEQLRIREGKNILPPTFVVDRVIAEMESFIAVKPQENILYTSAAEKIDKAGNLAGVREKLLEDAAAAIEQTVYPSYARLIAYFKELKSKTNSDDGVWKFPDGEAFYNQCLRSQTTTNLSADEIHNIGLTEVGRIQAEMRAILDAEGIAGGTVAESMIALSKEPRFLYPNTEEGKKQCIADYQTIIDEIDRSMDAAFDIRPEIGVIVEPIPAFKEKTAPGAYYNSPSLDGSRPGIFSANLRNMEEVPKYGMRTLAYHEAIPGHHFQLAIQQELTGVPTFRKVLPFTAYAEGWALYAEQLAWELGFQDDPYDNLGRLQGELFRAVRLVVDTGIHSKRWTREQAVEYMSANTGMPHGDVVAEIERYIVMPGQACAYKVGMMKILELRERAKTSLGDRFHLPEFHSVVLKNGSMPMEILEQVVDTYIQSPKADPKVARLTTAKSGN